MIETGSERGEANELVSKIDTALTKGAQAIAVDAGAVPDQLVSTLQRAADDGVPVIASGSSSKVSSPGTVHRRRRRQGLGAGRQVRDRAAPGRR